MHCTEWRGWLCVAGIVTCRWLLPKCSVVGVEENLLSMETVNARSSRAHSISHIRLPVVDWYRCLPSESGILAVPFVFTEPDCGSRKQLPDSALLVDMQYPS